MACLPSLLGDFVAVLASRQDVKVNDFVLRDFHHCSRCFSVASCELIFDYALYHCLSKLMHESVNGKSMLSSYS